MTIIQDLMQKTQNLKHDLFTTASNIRVGDNVWEHNVVQNIVRGKGRIIFNADSICRWEAKPTDRVMITARIPKNEQD